MRQRVIAVAIVAFMALVMIPIALMSNSNASEPTPAALPTGVLPTVTVKLPPVTVTLPPVIIPGPTKSITIVPPQPPPVTRTVHLPGGTVTKTVQQPGVTKTVTETAQPETVGPSELPSQSSKPDSQATKTVTVSPRQDPSSSATMNPDKPIVNFPAIDTTIEKIGYGILATLGLLGIVIGGILLGYYLGYKDKEDEEVGFWNSFMNNTVKRNK